jgi:hypothetical protein
VTAGVALDPQLHLLLAVLEEGVQLLSWEAPEVAPGWPRYDLAVEPWRAPVGEAPKCLQLVLQPATPSDGPASSTSHKDVIRSWQ